LGEIVEKMKKERRKATKTVVSQEKVFEENSILLVGLKEKGRKMGEDNA
jgi:hypothetical protein